MICEFLDRENACQGCMSGWINVKNKCCNPKIDGFLCGYTRIFALNEWEALGTQIIEQFIFTPKYPYDHSNQLTGQLYSKLDYKHFIIGGFGIWNSGHFITHRNQNVLCQQDKYVNDTYYNNQLDQDRIQLFKDHLEFPHLPNIINLNFTFISNSKGNAFQSSLGIRNLWIESVSVIYCIEFDKITNICTQCSNNKTLISGQCIPCNSSSCNCLLGYYLDLDQSICQQCYNKCSSCIQTSSNCLTCNSQLNLQSPPNCDICTYGYYITQSNNCMQCSSKCDQCQNYSGCITCSITTLKVQTCSCPNGYYNNCTRKCDLQCQNCKDNSSNCTICAGNRVNPPLCICPNDSVTQSSSIICLTKLIAQPTARFNDNLTHIIITFEQNITEVLTCSEVFDSGTLIMIGQNSECREYQNKMLIQMGYNSTVQINSLIVFKKDYLALNVDFPQILNVTVTKPDNLLLPNLTFNNYKFITTQCDDVMINIVSYTNNGQRNLKLISWNISNATDVSRLQPLLKILNSQLDKQSFMINVTFLQGQSNIRFILNYQNFLEVQSNSQVEIFIKPQILQLDIQVPSKIYFFENVQIIILPQLLSCFGSNITNSNVSVTYQIQSSNCNIGQIQNTQTMISGQSFIISSLILQSGCIYQVNVTGNVIDNSNQLYVSTVKQFSAMPADIQVSILGGDQMIGLDPSQQQQQFTFIGQIFDPNIRISPFNLYNYEQRWSCQNSVSQKPCSNFSQDTNKSNQSVLILSKIYQANTNLQIFYEAKSIEGLVFQTTSINAYDCGRNSKSNSDSRKLIFVVLQEKYL